MLPLCIYCCKDTTSECLPGHILILHVGDSEKTVSPIILKTANDTSCNRYKRMDLYENGEFFYLVSTARPLSHFTHTVSSNTYKKLKSVLLEYKPNNSSKRLVEERSFKFIVYDKCDSIAYYGFNGDPATDNLFSIMADILKKEKIDPYVTNRLEVYSHK